MFAKPLRIRRKYEPAIYRLVRLKQHSALVSESMVFKRAAGPTEQENELVPEIIDRQMLIFCWNNSAEIGTRGVSVKLYKVKVSSYIAQYPVLRTVQSALHFTSLTDLFSQTPSRLLWEASSHMLQLMREGGSYTYPPLPYKLIRPNFHVNPILIHTIIIANKTVFHFSRAKKLRWLVIKNEFRERHFYNIIWVITAVMNSVAEIVT